MKTKVSYLLLIYICITSTGNLLAARVEIEDSFRPGLIGHWTFDDLTEGLLRDSTEAGLDASVQGNVSIEDGIFAGAAYLRGRQAIRIKANEAFRDLPFITISTWVSPKELSGFREIFRKEDGNRRILFSFQNNGWILSLGLNVEG